MKIGIDIDDTTVITVKSMIKYADKVLQKLKEDGNNIYFITARLTNINNCNTKKITENTLKENNIPYDRLIINASDKLKVCKEEEIELFIEDSYDTCKELTENGIKIILMTTKMNQQIESGNIPRVHNWDEVYEKVEDINEMFANIEVKAIICSQGGQNANAILPYIDYEVIKNNPKK